MKILLLSLLLVPNLATARLWESQVDMTARFGNSRTDGNDESPFGKVAGCELLVFQKDDIICFAYFQAHNCICEAYQRADNDWLSKGQMQAVLDANEFGKPWKYERQSSGDGYWFKSDGSARASCFKAVEPGAPRRVIVTVPRFDEAMGAERKAKDDAERWGADFLAATPVPPSTPITQKIARSVTDSQRAAVQKHPDLSIAGGPLNRAFLARLADWKTAHDPRLDKSDWPERIADECDIPTPTVVPAPKLQTPAPPCPYQARAAHLSGAGVARATFNDQGHCSSVSIVQSTGSGILDSNTISWAEAHWTGPANSTKDVPVSYAWQ